MYRIPPVFLLLAFLFTFSVQVSAQKKHGSPVEPEKVSLPTAQDSLSYALGVNYGSWLVSRGLTGIDEKKFDQAIGQSLKGDSLAINAALAEKIISAQLENVMKEKSEEAIVEGQHFLEENKKKPGVVTLPGGLEYLILQQGTGPKPGPADTVVVHYEGKLISGKIFDSSIQRGQPLTIRVNGVIKGWSEALQLMPTGSKWRLFIPPDLGYGGRTMGPIPANSVLIFDVELLSIKK